VVTALISAVLFDFRITPAFVCSCIIVKVCCFIYHAAASLDASSESDSELISSSSSASALPDGEASVSANASVEYARVALDDASGPDGDQSFDLHTGVELQSVSSFSARSGGGGGIHVLEDDERANESATHSELASMPQFAANSRHSPASATVSFSAKAPRPKNALAK
jgi:hypothetical protein